MNPRGDKEKIAKRFHSNEVDALQISELLNAAHCELSDTSKFLISQLSFGILIVKKFYR